MLKSMRTNFANQSPDLIIGLWYKLSDMLSTRITPPSRSPKIIAIFPEDEGSSLLLGQDLAKVRVASPSPNCPTPNQLRSVVRIIALSALLMLLNRHKRVNSHLRSTVELSLSKLCCINLINTLPTEDLNELFEIANGNVLPNGFFPFITKIPQY